MTYVHDEIASQPDCWLRAARQAADDHAALPRPGERVAVVGCGTSWFIAQAYAARREQAGFGETHAHAASEFPTTRRYDRIVAITRSGSTTEVLDAIRRVRTPVTVIVGDPASPVVALATDVVAMPWADERSVVQTRFATSALALLRAALGNDLGRAAADAAVTVAAELPLDPAAVDQVTFVGRGWTVGLAHEAALKCREAAGLWTEAYPAMELRHGPIAICGPGRAVWAFGEIPHGLADEIRATGARFVYSRGATVDPMADLILAQRFAVALAAHRGLDPDTPRNLSRSVILPDASR
jgi:fructoselysine-6-P-deglycase FrlB-like protein